MTYMLILWLATHYSATELYKFVDEPTCAQAKAAMLKSPNVKEAFCIKLAGD